MISVIGKGSYGKVMLVKKRDTGQLYALKVLKKAEIIRRNQVEHTMTERRILVSDYSVFTLVYRKISDILSSSRWITHSRVIASFSLYLSTAQEVSFSFIFPRLEDSRKTRPDFMHLISC